MRSACAAPDNAVRQPFPATCTAPGPIIARTGRNPWPERHLRPPANYRISGNTKCGAGATQLPGKTLDFRRLSAT
ncbi:hypothetical protein GCM10011317_08510 [Niveispirillum cyanobacteriorum]|nr:hypothetical protein GCM10011317_08510 [Niveispirillum cyanobacteriorum]